MIDELRAWLKPLCYSDAINETTIKYILREFVMREVPARQNANTLLI